MEYHSKSEKDTMRIGEQLGIAAELGDVFCLMGDLGAGKTVFSKGFAHGMGINGKITSPTFTFVNEYTGRLPLYHFDAYRLESSAQAVCFDFEEYFEGGVCLIEWAGNVLDIVPESACFVAFKRVDDAENERIITVSRRE